METCANTFRAVVDCWDYSWAFRFWVLSNSFITLHWDYVVNWEDKKHQQSTRINGPDVQVLRMNWKTFSLGQIRSICWIQFSNVFELNFTFLIDCGVSVDNARFRISYKSLYSIITLITCHARKQSWRMKNIIRFFYWYN